MQPIDRLLAAALRGDREDVSGRLRAEPTLLYARNMFGVGVAHAARYGGHPEVLDIPELAGWTPDVITCAELGDTAGVRRALAADAGLATAFVGATTALHAAAYWGQHDLVTLLLESGADAVVNEPTRDSFLQIAPLASAVATTPGIPQPSHDEQVVLALVRLLLSHGAAVNARRGDGMTALHTAAWRGLSEVAAELLAAGADPEIAAGSGPHSGETAADTALSQGHLVLAARLDAGD